MAATVELVNPRKIHRNKDNPRLIFHEEELSALEDSIREQGILVPLAVFQDGQHYTLLDGERRWRCSIRIGLHSVPVIVQAKPDRMTNIMMMFAIHNARQDWDPLPAALKLEELEQILTKALGSAPSEKQLAASASLTLGEVRRYKKILALDQNLRSDLMAELQKPREEQKLTVDHVIEAVSGVNRIAKAGVVPELEKPALLQTIVEKFRNSTIKSTVEPRKLSRIARAVEREEVDEARVRQELKKFQRDKNYSIDDIFRNTVEEADFAHGTEQLIRRALVRLNEISERQIAPSEDLRVALKQFIAQARAILGQ